MSETFEKVAVSVNPYWAVLTAAKYRDAKHLDREAFYASGAGVAERICGLAGQERFDSVLEYGVGVGRVLKHMIPRCGRAYGVDISPTMLRAARRACPGAGLLAYGAWAMQRPRVELAYSVITLQHIQEREGLGILYRLLNDCNVACMQVLVGNTMPTLTRLLFKASFVPGFAALSNVLRGRSWREPRIPMRCWDAALVLKVFSACGFHKVGVSGGLCPENRWRSLFFYGRRP